jgi:hypothetical protein
MAFMRSVLEMDGSDALDTTKQCIDTLGSATLPVRLLTLLKENRIEMMVVTILLYSTGLLNQAVEYGQGVC